MAKFTNIGRPEVVDLGNGITTREALSGTWAVREYVSQAIDRAARASAEHNDPQPLKDVIELISRVGEAWRFVGCDHSIIASYRKLLYTIVGNARALGSHFPDVVAQVDRSEIYFNIGVLKFQEEAYDDGLQWLCEADREYARVSGAPEGSYLRTMVDDQTSPLWNFTDNMIANCSDFMPGVFGPYEFKGVFGRRMTGADVRTLLKDFETPALLQFLHSFLAFWKTLTTTHGVVRFVRLSRVVGELAYLLDCYLGKQPACAGINNMHRRLEQITSNDPLVKAEFDRTHAALGSAGGDVARVNAHLEQLALLMEGEPSGVAKWAHCLLVAHRVRNYASHDLDDRFILNKRQDMVKKLFLATLMSFFVTRKLSGVWSI